MENKKGSLDLLKFKGSRKVSLSGQKGIFIPVEAADGSPINPSIYVNEKHAYCDIRVTEHAGTRKGADGQEHPTTHWVKVSVPKAIRDRYAEDKETLYSFTPILGNLEDDVYQSQATYSEEQEDMPENVYNGGQPARPRF